LLKAWLDGLSPATQVWEGFVKAAHAKVQGLNKKKFGPNLRERYYECRQTIVMAPEYAKNLGMEPELPKTLFGDPADYNVTVCSPIHRFIFVVENGSTY
jgi:hypothetical protein